MIDQNEERRIIRRERIEAEVEAMIRRKSIGIVKRRGSTGQDREMEQKRRKTRNKKDRANIESIEEVRAVPKPNPKSPKNSEKNPQPQKATLPVSSHPVPMITDP